MKLVLDFLIFVSELVMLVCAIAFVVIAVRFVFSLAKEAVSARFPKVAKFVEKNYRYWLIAIFVVLFLLWRVRAASLVARYSLAPKLRVP